VRSPDPEAIPLLARACLDRVKVLPGVEIYGDRRHEVDDAICRVLDGCFVERGKLLNAAKSVRRRDPERQLVTGDETWVRSIARELVGLPFPRRRGPQPGLVAGGPRGAHSSPLVVELCVALVHCGDFAEVSATATGLEDAFWSTLSAHVPRPEIAAPARCESGRTTEPSLRGDPEARARLKRELLDTIPGDGLLEQSIRRLVQWFRGGGGDPPSSGPPAVPV